MKEAGFLRDLADMLARFAYGNMKSFVRADLDGACKRIAEIIDTAFPRIVTSARDAFQPDVERIAMFAVLFRTQADQARRMDAVDATFGVFLTALLVVGPLAFEKAPSTADRWIAAVGFGLLIILVALGLFGIGGREPKIDIALQLAADLRSPDRGSYENLRETLNSLRDDPLGRPAQDVALRRGAAGAIARLTAQDRLALVVKRSILGTVAVGTLGLAVTIGVRDVIQLPSEDRHGVRASISRQTSAPDIRHQSADSGERRIDLRSGHPASGLTSPFAAVVRRR